MHKSSDPFICTIHHFISVPSPSLWMCLIGTYQTPHQLVMVTEPLDCGDLWSVIYETYPFNVSPSSSSYLSWWQTCTYTCTGSGTRPCSCCCPFSLSCSSTCPCSCCAHGSYYLLSINIHTYFCSIFYLINRRMTALPCRSRLSTRLPLFLLFLTSTSKALCSAI